MPTVDEFTVVFNNSVNTPGFDITIEGISGDVTSYTVFRRDITGLYADMPVRGMDMVTVTSPDVVGQDYEAPLGMVLQYYIRLYVDETATLVGPVDPTPDPFIPTMPNAYGGGIAYLKNVEQPALSKAVNVQSFPGYDRPIKVLAEHEPLGREMPIVMTDVLKSRRGTFTLNCWSADGQTHWDIEAMISKGATLLLQNNNPRSSGVRDMYFKAVSYKMSRYNVVSSLGLQDVGGSTEQILAAVEIGFIEVARPPTQGISVGLATWQDVADTYATWQDIADAHSSWLSLLETMNELVA